MRRLALTFAVASLLLAQCTPFRGYFPDELPFDATTAPMDTAPAAEAGCTADAGASCEQ